MVDLVELSGNVDVGADVVVYELEVRLAVQEWGHVLDDARCEVVYTNDLIALGEEPLAEVAPDETSPSRNQRPQPSGPWPSHCHSLVRNPCTTVLLPWRRQHRGRYGRPR